MEENSESLGSFSTCLLTLTSCKCIWGLGEETFIFFFTLFPTSLQDHGYVKIPHSTCLFYFLLFEGHCFLCSAKVIDFGADESRV